MKPRKAKLVAAPTPQKTNVLKFDRSVKKVHLIPRNTAQEAYVEELFDESKRIVVGYGPAGTGKSLLATLYAIKAFKNGDVKKIIITRPAVEVAGEKIGHLPGTLEEKMAPWTRPIIDIFDEYYTKPELTAMIEEGVVEIVPLAFMRGRTFKDAFIVADEIQNCTPEQVKMLLTRIGEGTRCAVTGDLDQTDIKGVNGLLDLVKRMDKSVSKTISMVKFEREHIERDPIVSEVLRIYE